MSDAQLAEKSGETEPHRTSVRRVSRPRIQIPMGVFVFVAIAMALDTIADVRSGSTAAHSILEAIMSIAAAAGAVLLWRELQAERELRAHVVDDLAQARSRSQKLRAEAEQWRTRAEEALRGLGEAIDEQFGAWSLTPAEREVGLLLLKGLSHKEIAELRKTGERTVRQQANSLYKKAGLSGRAELSAFFLEDLLLPRQS
jgi:DNA-binding NarL/FixJ family response regulator